MQTLNLDGLSRGLRRARATWIAAALVVGCGGGSELLLVPFFTFGFSFNGTLGGANHTVSSNFNPNQPTNAEGDFEEFSQISLDGNTYDVTGRYSGCSMTMRLTPKAPNTTPAPAPFASNYTGRFTSRDVMELTPNPAQAGREVLVLTRATQPISYPPAAC